MGSGAKREVSKLLSVITTRAIAVATINGLTSWEVGQGLEERRWDGMRGEEVLSMKVGSKTEHEKILVLIFTLHKLYLYNNSL